MGRVQHGNSTSRLARVVLATLMLCALLAQSVPAFAVPPAVTGTVRNADTNAVLPGVQVALWDTNDPEAEMPVAETVTDSNGYYAFSGIPISDAYVIAFYKTGYAYNDVYDVNYSGPAIIVNMSLTPLSRIAVGTVTDADTSAAVEGALVDAFYYVPGDDYFWVGSGTTDSSGEYVVFDEYESGAGEYQLAVSHNAYLYADATVDWDGTDPVEQDFTLASAPQIVEGVITDQVSGDPIAEVTVDAGWWNDADSYYEWTGSGFSDATGAYGVYDSMEMGSGDYELSIMHDGYRSAQEYVTWDSFTVLTQNFALLPPVKIAAGTVTASDTSGALEGATVDASRWDTIGEWYEWTGTGYADEMGQYKVYDELDLGAGEYQLLGAAGGYVSSVSLDTWNGVDALSQSFVLEPAPAIAYGTVTDAVSGDPLADVSMEASWWNSTDEFWEYAGSAYTDEFGEYTLLDEWGWGAGTYELGAWANGYHYQTATDLDWDGTDALNVDFAMSNEAIEIPVAGADRFKTAVEASQLAFPEDGTCETAVIASGRNFPDALGGAALSGALNGPVLLTEPTSLPLVVAEEIERLGVSNVIIVGGTSAVSAGVKTAIDNLPGVSTERINGVTRYETAAMVAERTLDELGPDNSGRVMVATGQNFPDALAGAPLAAYAGTPILLVTKDVIPSATLDFLESNTPDSVIVLGGTGAVSADISAEIEDIIGRPGAVERLDGANRYETAAEIAQYGVDSYGMSWDRVALATGTNFPDALAGGAAQGLRGSVVLLTRSTTLEAAPRVKLEDNAGEILEVRFFGGLSAISQTVRDAVMQAIADNKTF